MKTEINTDTIETRRLWHRYLAGDIITTRDVFDFARQMEHERNMARAAANTFRQCAEITFGPMPFARKFHWENAHVDAQIPAPAKPESITA